MGLECHLRTVFLSNQLMNSSFLGAVYKFREDLIVQEDCYCCLNNLSV